MQVIKKNGHNDICGGYSYNYEIKLETENATVADAIKEIVKWRKKDKEKGAYGTYVNGEVVESTWSGETEDHYTTWRKKYTGDGSEKVLSITGEGGWYCGVSFDIIAEKKVIIEETKKIDGVNYNNYKF